MRLDSVRGLKQQLLLEVIAPLAQIVGIWRPGLAWPGAAGELTTRGRGGPVVPARVARTVALGVTQASGREYALAVRVQRPALLATPTLARVTREARGEVDVRVVGRIGKRTPGRMARPSGDALSALSRRPPWYRRATRPLLLGASAGHEALTAGTIGAFVERNGVVHLLSSNHVLADEDNASRFDWVLQPGAVDGGGEGDRVGRLSTWVRLRNRRSNEVDAALARLAAGVTFDPSLLRDVDRRCNQRLRGLAGDGVQHGEAVFKIGRTTGPRTGRVTAFDLDNLVVGYDRGNLRFDNQIEIEGAGRRPFSDGGDSGALVVDAGMRAVALVFAGADAGGRNGLGLTYANPLGPVLASLEASLLS